MKITYNQLVEHKACEKQRELFKQTFGDSVVITEEIVKKYYEDFDYEWVIGNLFPEELLDEYEQGLKAIYNKYYQDLKAIDNEYEQGLKAIRDKYCQDCAMLFYKLSLDIN